MARSILIITSTEHLSSSVRVDEGQPTSDTSLFVIATQIQLAFVID
ncbi:MAG TPA: hypothetical protein VK582_04350 [Pyrinomonadaceae bacterium]|nr:hypothetical protein [Pyrinomonadaceae bacterium]